MKIDSQERFNQVVVDALRNLYLLDLSADAAVADSYGVGSCDEVVRAQIADLQTFAWPGEVTETRDDDGGGRESQGRPTDA